MYNDLGNDSTRAYSPVSISGGTFYGNNPSQDDNVTGENGNFLMSGYKVTQQGTDNVWKVTKAN